MSAGFRFRVDPAFVCRRARDLVLDDEPMQAIRLLGEAFGGLDLNATFDILKGHSILTAADGGADIVPDESREAGDYRKSLADAFSHRVRIGGRWHEPYAMVENLGEADVDGWRGVSAAAGERAYRAWTGTARGANLVSRVCRSHFEEACRPLHYASNPDTDTLIYLSGGFHRDGKARSYTDMRVPRPAFFRDCNAPPPWMTGSATPQAALDAGVASGHVDLRGHEAWYGRSGPRGDRPDPARREEAGPPGPRHPESPSRNPSEAPAGNLAARAAFPVLVEPRSPEADARFRSLVPDIRAAVMEQAGRSGGFVDVDLGAGPVRVPRAPLERWALSRVKALDKAPAWTPVSPPDLKLVGDDRDHSDWLVGAGIDPFSWHGAGEDGRRLREAGYEAMHRIQDERLNKVHHAVLCGEGTVSGPVWIARPGDLPALGSIVVLPNASPSWLTSVQAAIGANPGIGGVIVEEGGAMAHLVSILREGGAPVIRWPGARKALADVTHVRIDCADGSVETLGYGLGDPEEEEASPFGMR